MHSYQRHSVTIFHILYPLVFFSISFWALPCITFAQNSIISDATLGTQVQLNGSNYLIGGGTIREGNQFHSFAQFNIYENEMATFTGPETVENIIGRVTGGTESWIDGLVKSDVPGANLFLLNPSGVLFGPNASLDVSGSFHVSTADHLRLGDGDGSIYTDPIVGDILTVDAPSAFGFLNDNPAGISIQESTIEVPEGETISLVGGDITIGGIGVNPNYEIRSLAAHSGRINIASVASQGEVIPNATGESPDLRLESFETLGKVELHEGAAINASGNPGGSVFIRGGQFVMSNAFINTGSYGDLDHPGVGVDINVMQDMVVGRELPDGIGRINSSSHGAGDAGDIRIVADSLLIEGTAQPSEIFPDGAFSAIASRVFDSGSGGNIDIFTGTLTLRDRSGIVTQVFGPGSGGNIEIATNDLQIESTTAETFVSTATYGQWNSELGGYDPNVDSGDAGNLTVNAESVLLRGSAGFTGLTTQVNSSVLSGDPNAGVLQVNTGSLHILDGAEISSGVFAGPKDAGIIDIEADTVRIAGVDTSGNCAGIYSSSSWYATGSGGVIQINADDIQLADRGQINAYSSTYGDSGNILLESGTLDIASGGMITSTNYGAGRGGNIDVIADSISATGPSPTNSYTGIASIGGIFSSGAGDITVRTNTLGLSEGAQFSTSTFGPGPGGTINVFADNVQIFGSDPSSISANGINSGLFASTAVYSDYTSYATGHAGDINIQAGLVEMREHAEISAFSQSAGYGGRVSITAEDIFYADNSRVTTASDHTEGGDINILAERVELVNRSLVSAESYGPGDAGDIGMTALDTLIMANSAVATQALQADGGNVHIEAGYMLRLIDSQITASVGGGVETVGGNIFIDPVYVILDGSMILANAFEGTGGNILIFSDVFLADPGSLVDASSDLGIDGQVDIQAPIISESTLIMPLEKDFKSAAELLRKPCMARIQGGKYSSFIIGGRDGLPLEPGGLLPSSLFLN